MSIKDDIYQKLDALSVTDLTALYLIISEREGQLTREGWTPEHDDHQRDGALGLAAAAYAKAAHDKIQGQDVHCPQWWPWSIKWFKPHGFQRNLERSGALILAEMSRLLRMDADVSD